MMISKNSCCYDNSCSDFDLSRVVVWFWSSQYMIIWVLRATWLKTILNRAKVLNQFENKRHVHECSNAKGIGAKLHLSFTLVWCMSLSSPNTNLLKLLKCWLWKRSLMRASPPLKLPIFFLLYFVILCA